MSRPKRRRPPPTRREIVERVLLGCDGLDDVDFVSELVVQLFAAGQPHPRLEESMLIDAMKSLALTVEQIRGMRRRLGELQIRADLAQGGA